MFKNDDTTWWLEVTLAFSSVGSFCYRGQDPIPCDTRSCLCACLHVTTRTWIDQRYDWRVAWFLVRRQRSSLWEELCVPVFGPVPTGDCHFPAARCVLFQARIYWNPCDPSESNVWTLHLEANKELLFQTKWVLFAGFSLSVYLSLSVFGFVYVHIFPICKRDTFHRLYCTNSQYHVASCSITGTKHHTWKPNHCSIRSICPSHGSTYDSSHKWYTLANIPRQSWTTDYSPIHDIHVHSDSEWFAVCIDVY